jgi:hypothetical protein
LIRRLGCLTFIVVLLAALVGFDLYARGYAQDQLARRIAVAFPGTHNVSASISSFPFLGRLAVAGEVSALSAHAGPVTEGRITFDSIDASLKGVRLDRTELVRNRRLQLLGLRSGRVSAVVTSAELSQALGGVPVTLLPGHVTVVVRGIPATASVALVNNELRLQPVGLALITVQIPTNSLLPCAADVTVGSGRLTVTCVVTRVPDALLQTANQYTG